METGESDAGRNRTGRRGDAYTRRRCVVLHAGTSKAGSGGERRGPPRVIRELFHGSSGVRDAP